MKNFLTLSILAVLGSLATVELARAAGIQTAATLNTGSAFLVFTFISVVLIMLADYGRKLPALRVSPTVSTTTRRLKGRSIAAAHHHVYAIRRGAQAARLAQPASVVVFPRQAVVRLRRVA